MSFGFNASNNAMSGNVNAGPDLETIQTEALGFLSIAGDAKVRLTSAWDSLPAATSSLLSVASKRGLVAAAGPDQLVIATTESIRKAFESPKDGDSDIRAFEPQLKIPMPMRVSQLVFTSDENHLVLSAESGGGLAVYEVSSLLQGSSNSAFELSTNGEALRSLVPNPTVPELCAIVTNGGNLHMANLQERKISNALKSQVSCISWSSKGKQLCAGLADGTIHQMTPEGEGKADIPKPPNVDNCHVSSLTWLENNLFLAIHSTNDSPPSSIYHIITRQPPSSFTYQKLTDPVEPFGSDKTPHHSILRLRDFPPDLQDLLIVSSTASTDIGLLTRSKNALATDKPAESITGVFTTTELLDDSKRPTLPMTDSMEDSTPIGIALDLSSKDKVYKPIPSDEELEESPTPLPGFWVLTHEGVLCSWWIIYTDSIKKGTAYPGLTAVQGDAASAPAAAATSASPFSSATPAAPAFGSAAPLGQKASPWGSGGSGTAATPSAGGGAFGSSAFGSASSAGAAFGKPSAIGFGQAAPLGTRASPWASAGAATGSTSAAQPAFGQSGFASFANKAPQSAFATAAQSSTTPGSSGGFASFSTQGGFASLAGSSGNTGGSIFGSGGKLAGAGSAFGSGSTDTAFPSKPSGSVVGSAQEKPSGSVFGSTPFKLESSFKPDPAQAENDTSSAPTGSSMFGSAFGSALNDAGAKAADDSATAKDEDMDTGDTPSATLGSGLKFGAAPTTAGATSIFGKKTDAPKTTSGGLFGSGGATPKPAGSSPAASSGLFGSASKPDDDSKTPVAKSVETFSAPLPPDATSKSSYQIGESLFGSGAASKPSTLFSTAAKDTAAQSKTADSSSKPNPFLTASKPSEEKPTSSYASKSNKAAAPASFELPSSTNKAQPKVPSPPAPASDEEEESDLSDNASEGSGVDVAKDLGLGARTSQSSAETPRPLFGEVGRSTPSIPQPDATKPRSPSPMRAAARNRALLSEANRSVSAPGVASELLAPKRAQLVASNAAGKEKTAAEDTFIAQSRKLRERQQAEESRLLIDEEDEEVQRLDEFIAHSNIVPPAQESIPAQVEAVYRDINSMIDTLGLNARSVMAFIKGHTDHRDPDDWLFGDLEEGRVQDLPDKLEACQELARDMHRLRAKQEDLKRVIMTRQAQQNELRREYANFSKLLAEAEEALTLLKTRIASISGASGRGGTNVPTVEAVMKTITKMTSMVEKRSGDIDVLETQLRRMRLEPSSREESPFRTPQSRRSILLSPEVTPARSLRQSISGSVIGFSREEKGELMDKRAKRQAVLGRLKESVQKKGVSVWNMEDIE
ncbi:hypothetical protein BBK36DRAFT_1170190 [Trichoderma citrinoviride]|uniref:Nucleoporin Nup159/Nup146 N-terminal domain-containing protein n=1 Tax=Trichoderma citrinoviride TaxID=58853 RepID=A0A2T4B8A6_9HYPO|nr:hypothetical protein BBK36DRAFT_1170190 [Trichoderma citrinoviride]PTB65459.1 hypothetical protein BBK36DRAFT_1170190 [Trichoderma citrinoviride]